MIIVVSGTGTEIGKTITTAAIAANALAEGKRVAVMKPAQSGVGPDELGDVQEVARLAGDITAVELVRFAEPLGPATAARRAGLPSVYVAEIAQRAKELDAEHDLVLIEGIGGLLVHLNDADETIADVALALDAPVVVVVAAGLGTLNATALTAEALRNRGIECAGLVVGSWPAEPDLASLCNLEDLPHYGGAPLIGVLPEGLAQRADFRDVIPHIKL